MKYTIELTNKQKAVLESLLEIIHRHIGFNAKLESMEIVPIKDLLNKERQDGYNQGFEDGKNDAVYNTELIEELKQREYNRGLEDARQTTLELLKISSGEYGKMFGSDDYYYTQIILEHFSITEIKDRIKAYEEKAEEEIKVGDEVIITGLKDEKTKGVIIMLASNNIAFICLINNSEMATVTKNDVTPTGKHYDIESILKELGE